MILERIGYYTGDLFPLPPVATVTLKTCNVRRPTFKAFLVDDDGVVLRSLCQTEKLASEKEDSNKEYAKHQEAINLAITE